MSRATRNVGAEVAGKANEAARMSRRSGAPVLSADSTRADLLSWLQWNDPNGEYGSPECDLSLDEAWNEISAVLEDA